MCEKILSPTSHVPRGQFAGGGERVPCMQASGDAARKDGKETRKTGVAVDVDGG